MAEIVRDGFIGTPGGRLDTLDPRWARQTGITGAMSYAADGASVYTTTTATAAYYRSDVVPPSADYFVSADITMDEWRASRAAGVIARALSAAITHYQVRYLTGSTSGGTWQLRRIVNNTASTLASVAGTFDAGQTKNVKLGTSGANVSVYLDNNPVPLLGPVSSTLTDAGYAGIIGGSGTGADFRIDNFVVDDGVVASGSTTTVTPAKASLSVSGFAPTVGRTANQSVSPTPAAISVQGFAPVIARSANQSVAPGPVSLTVRGYAPSVTQSAGGSVSPAAAALAVRGFTPTIGQTTTRMLTPAPAALQVRGFAPTISQPGQSTGTPPESSSSGGGGAYGGSGSVREVRAFADLLDRAERPTKNERKRRKRAIEAAVLDLLPDEPAAEKAAPVIAQMVERELPAAVWAPVRAMQPVTQPRTLPAAVVEDVRAKVAEWLAEQERIALLEDDFETELLLMG